MDANLAVDLDDLDRQILHTIQFEFPVVDRPFYEIANQLCSTEEIVLNKVRRFNNLGLIRRMGASVNSRMLGFVSTLVALKVDAQSIENVAKVINQFSGVTHNYLREGEYNMWFAIIAANQEELDKVLSHVADTEGVTTIRSLPAKRVFKVSVRFPMAR